MLKGFDTRVVCHWGAASIDAATRRQLLNYCGLDTLALPRLRLLSTGRTKIV